MALTPDMIDKILSEHKDLYRADDINKTKVESLPIGDIDNTSNTTIDLSDVKYSSRIPYADINNDVANRRRIKVLAIIMIIFITILFVRDLIKCFKNN